MIAYGEAGITTSDATPVGAAISTPQENGTFVVVGSAVVRQRNGTGRAAFRQSALVSNNAGTVVADAVGTQEAMRNAGAAAWTFALSIVNGQVVGTLTGAAGVVTDCQCNIEGFQIGPF